MTKSTFLASALLAGAALTATAATEPIVMGDENREIVAGEAYLIPQYATSSGHYVSPSNSKIYLDGASDFRPYSDPEHTEIVPVTALGYTGSMSWFMGEEGVTYYFYTGFSMNRQVFTLYQEGVADKPLEIYLLEPSTQNTTVDFNNYPNLTITFNQDIQLAENVAYIEFANRLTGSKERVEVRASASGQNLRLPMYSTLKPFMESGAIKTNDEFRILIGGLSALTGVTYSDVDEDGNLVITYLCGSLPVVVVKQQLPTKFLSYWAPGAPEGMVVMEFDAPLMNDGRTTVELGWGNAEGEGEFYAETIVCEIEGNTLKADLTGKLRTPATMTPQYPSASYPTMALDVKNVRDEHGVPVASPGLGTTGSYSFALPYELIDRTNVISEFSPKSGSLLEDVDNINIWMTGLSSITFDGFLLTVTDKENNVTTRTIAKADTKETVYNDNEAEYDFTLPADVKANAKRVEITLAGIESLDGYQHDNEVRCIYGGFAILYSEPANNEEIAILTEGYRIMIEQNLGDIYPDLYVEYQIVDTDPENLDPIVKSTSWMNRQDDGSYAAEIPMDIKLYAGHDYKIEISAWQDEMTRWNDEKACLGTDFILVKGLTPAYHYSTLTLLEVLPSTDELVDADLTEITVKFEGFAYLGNYDEGKGALATFINEGQGVTIPFAKVTPVDPYEVDGTVCATEWVLALPEGYVAGLTAPLEIDFTAYDQEGVQLRGNKGAEENSCFEFVWKVAGQYDSVEVKAVGNEASLGDVKEFTVYNAAGVTPSWNIPFEDAAVLCKGEKVAHVADIPFNEDITTLTLVLDKALTDNGDYTLIIPEGFFVIGDGEETAVKSSLAVEYAFTISEGSGAAVEGVAGETTFTVYNAAGMMVLENSDAAAVSALPAGLYIINGRKVMKK